MRRKAFLARLGHEANDALDEFLNLALAYESRQTPSLQGFVHWIRTASTEVKRDMEIARDEVRVMTVHGAKGLEAPVVVLADTTTEPAGPQIHHPKLFSLPAQNAAPARRTASPGCRPSRKTSPVVASARAAMMLDNENEYRRLLYVAMTRAADRLIVCGSVGQKKMPAGCWYQLIEQGLEADGPLAEEPGDVKDMTGPALSQVRAGNRRRNAAPAHRVRQRCPDWLTHAGRRPSRRAPRCCGRPAPVDDAGSPRSAAQRAPPRAGARHACASSDAVAARRSAPRSAPTRRGAISRASATSPTRERAEIAQHTLRLLGDLRFDALFLPGSRAEISIVGRIGGRRRLGPGRPAGGDDGRGADRRLQDQPSCARAASARRKTRHPDYIRQLALYRAVLMQLYPGRPVRAALLWTETPDLMEIPAVELECRAILTSA